LRARYHPCRKTSSRRPRPSRSPVSSPLELCGQRVRGWLRRRRRCRRAAAIQATVTGTAPSPATRLRAAPAHALVPTALIVDVVDGKDGGEDEDVVLPVGYVDYELFPESHLARHGPDYARRARQRVVPTAEISPDVNGALARGDLKVLTKHTGVVDLGHLLASDNYFVLIVQYVLLELCKLLARRRPESDLFVEAEVPTHLKKSVRPSGRLSRSFP
jgi:hypothetical protein